jgi:hypothetical protein
MSYLPDGGTADPAVWNDWLKSVSKAQSGATEAQLKLNGDK